MEAFIKIQSIWQKDDQTLAIEWTNQEVSEINVVALRRKCPCASCVDEFTGLRTLQPETISPEVRPKMIKSVGQYALSIQFSDGHKTGIYTYDYLKSLEAHVHSSACRGLH